MFKSKIARVLKSAEGAIVTNEEKLAKLAVDYAEYQAESKRMEAEGKSIGTFSSWQFATGKNTIKIAMTREEHFKTSQK